jgi:NADH dehydrogenase
MPVSDRVQHFLASVTDVASIEAAIDSADAVANAVSLYIEKGDATFRAIHLEAARAVAEAAARHEARLVHVSGIGADPAAASPYVRFRGLGEDAVRAACDGAAVLRPAVMIGAGDAFLTALAGVVRFPVVPLFGDGRTRLAPVFVGDVAEAAAIALTGPDPHTGISELGGPEALAYRDLVRRVAQHLGRRPILLPLPFPIWDTLAAAGRLLPRPPITEGQVALMQSDNVPSPSRPGLAAFGVDPTDLATVLREALPRP